MHEELALAPEESTTPFLLTPNSIDLSCEHLFTMVETPTHTTNFSLCSYKKALCSVIHLWEKGHGEEAQITLDSLHKEFQGLVCPDRSERGWNCQLTGEVAGVLQELQRVPLKLSAIQVCLKLASEA